METANWNYFEFRKGHDYPIYIRFSSEEWGGKLNHVLKEMGFIELTPAEVKKINIYRSHLRILSVQKASSRVENFITGPEHLDVYGCESLSLQGGVPIYTYRRVALMGQSRTKTVWDLALVPDMSLTEHMINLRIVIVRFISQALADMGVLSFWGTVKDETVIIMKQGQSFGEAVFIDLSKRMIFSSAGELKFTTALKILRKDKENNHSFLMKREEVIAFMSVSTCLLSFNGITPQMKKSVYELSSIATTQFVQSERLFSV